MSFAASLDRSAFWPSLWNFVPLAVRHCQVVPSRLRTVKPLALLEVSTPRCQVTWTNPFFLVRAVASPCTPPWRRSALRACCPAFAFAFGWLDAAAGSAYGEPAEAG